MALTSGARIGPYEIVTLLGAGGMGEVYRARDSKLNRSVAIKVLPDAFAADTERLARFTREAQTLGSLNHPHIAHIYGLEESGGVRALVMELVEGEDLSQRIARGAIPLDEALPMARQIAEALEAAHEQGIIHRDLKPANIKVRPDGTVKVLDFGLAKAMEAQNVSNATVANSPTALSPHVTQQGVLLGTAAYMSPEQARGKAVDKRTDIWAFGVVLYEMLTGTPAFPGDSVVDVMARVVSRDPDWSVLPTAVPGTIVNMLRRCVEKNGRERLRDIGEARVALSAIVVQHDGDAAIASLRGRSRSSVFRWVAAAVTLAVIGGGIVWFLRQAPAPPLRNLELALPAAGMGFTLSPNGAFIAYREGDRVFLLDLERFETRELAASAPAQRNEIFWSPDSAFVGFNDSAGKLWIAPAGGGAARMVAEIPETGQLMGAAWGTNGVIVLAVWRGSLYEVPSSGGVPTLVSRIDSTKEVDFHLPVLLPDGRIVVGTHLQPAHGTFRLEVVSKTSREVALAGAFSPVAYVAPGYLLVWRIDVNEGIWSFPFSGTFPLQLDSGVLVAPRGEAGSAGGQALLYSMPSSTPSSRDLVSVDRAGRISGSLGTAMVGLAHPALSPDGRSVAFTAREGDAMQIFTRHVARATHVRVTQEAGRNDRSGPKWFPSGERLIYSQRVAAGVYVLAVANADGSGGRREVGRGFAPTVSPDGHYVAYLIDDRGQYRARYSQVLPDGTLGPSLPIVKSAPEPIVLGLAFSPDTRYIAYAEPQPGGSPDLFVTRFPSGEGRWTIATQGARAPVWSASGELFFLRGGSGPRDMMSVSITTSPTPTVGVPVQLFAVGADLDVSTTPFYYDLSTTAPFDATRDGKTFVMLRPQRSAGSVGAARWVLVQNWTTRLHK